ncbi:hypothetical protein D6D01_05018 [Aureobasidium pullulans]|uniref:Uncharacterized protein n=1 Tax=Aureobasidium pullulans TaxID=5580 RepID=A0A4S9L9I0_AURPU|nr:hypothetical protein D6D01_05018 [Aureobasidium pullulans]
MGFRSPNLELCCSFVERAFSKTVSLSVFRPRINSTQQSQIRSCLSDIQSLPIRVTFPQLPRSCPFSALLVVQARLPTPDTPISRPQHRIANTSSDIEANRGFWLLSTLYSPMTYRHISSHTVFDPSSQRIVTSTAPPPASMATAEEDAIEATIKSEAAEEEKSKKIFEDVSKKREQKDKNHGINERSHVSSSDTIHMLERKRTSLSSRELEGLKKKLKDLKGGVMSLDVGLEEAEERLKKARQKLVDMEMEEKLNESTPTSLAR